MKSNIRNTLSHLPGLNQTTAITLSAGAVCIAGCGILFSDTISYADQSEPVSIYPGSTDRETFPYDTEYIEAYGPQWTYTMKSNGLFQPVLYDPEAKSPLSGEERLPLK